MDFELYEAVAALDEEFPFFLLKTSDEDEEGLPITEATELPEH